LDGTVAKKVKNVFPGCHALALGEGGLFPECHVTALGGRRLFLECRFLALEEGSLPLVSLGSTRENIFIFLFFSLFFGDALPHYLKLFAQVWFNFEFLGIFR
jgi:hypothetical protein